MWGNEEEVEIKKVWDRLGGKWEESFLFIYLDILLLQMRNITLTTSWNKINILKK